MLRIQSQSPAAQEDFVFIIAGVKLGSDNYPLIALKLFAGTNSRSIFSLNPSNTYSK